MSSGHRLELWREYERPQRGYNSEIQVESLRSYLPGV